MPQEVGPQTGADEMGRSRRDVLLKVDGLDLTRDGRHILHGADLAVS